MTARDVICGTCGAAPGERCTAIQGPQPRAVWRRTRVKTEHEARQRRANRKAAKELR